MDEVNTETFDNIIENPELEQHRVTILNSSQLDSSTQKQIRDTVSPEVMDSSTKYWAGINVLGGGLLMISMKKRSGSMI